MLPVLTLALLVVALPAASSASSQPAEMQRRQQQQRTQDYLRLLERVDWVNFVEGRVQGWPGSLDGQPPLVEPFGLWWGGRRHNHEAQRQRHFHAHGHGRQRRHHHQPSHGRRMFRHDAVPRAAATPVSSPREPRARVHRVDAGLQAERQRLRLPGRPTAVSQPLPTGRCLLCGPCAQPQRRLPCCPQHLSRAALIGWRVLGHHSCAP
eukprot:COSAG06_NODE_5060_length_3754_cov_1.959519_1_plen_208_part_00